MANITSLYTRLDPTKSEIRVLEIIHGDSRRNASSDDAAAPGSKPLVQCRLRIVSLDDQPEFCALSYVWGDQTQTAPISVSPDTTADADIEKTSQVVQVTINLESALRHVRRRYVEYRHDSSGAVSNGKNDCNGDTVVFWLWVDAVCINQGDASERTQQVQLMGRIYSSAQLVIGWLGMRTDLKPGFDAIETIANGKQHWDLVEDHELSRLGWLADHPEFFAREGADGQDYELRQSKALRAIDDVFTLPYWERVWIFQEIVLAADLLLTTSTCSLPWKSLRDGAQFLHRISQHALNFPSDIHEETSIDTWMGFQMVRHPYILSLVSNFQAQGWMGEKLPLRDKPGNKGQTEAKKDKKRSPWRVSLEAGMNLKATDPRDHIYGLSGLMRLDIKMDYSGSTSVGSIFAEFAAGYLKSELSGYQDRKSQFPLEFLEFAGTGLYGHDASFPSWVPNFVVEANSEWGNEPTKASWLSASLMADKDVFPSDDNIRAYVQGLSLFAPAVLVEHVSTTFKLPDSLDVREGRLLEYVANFVSLHPRYVSGIPSLQAVFSLFTQDTLGEISDKRPVLLALELVRMLICETGLLFDAIKHLKRLGFDGQITGFNRWFVDNFFSACQARPDSNQGGSSINASVDLESLGFQWNLLLELLLFKAKGSMKAVWGELSRNMSKVSKSRCVFTTSRGYLGLAPIGTEKGDELHILQDCGVPVVLRKIQPQMQSAGGDGKQCYSLVGTAFVVGLMRGEACKYVESGEATVEVVEVR